jgi:phospholipase A-2-activating protein
MDTKIRIFTDEGNPVGTLEGHSKGVISFSWTTTGLLISGSWDGTAKVWNLETNSCVQTLEPHENGVHVLGLENGLIATTSTGESVDGKPANFKLRIWDPATGRLVGSPICDHAGSIRSITALRGVGGFATGANDGTVALRSVDGEVLGTVFHAAQEDGSAPFILDW